MSKYKFSLNPRIKGIVEWQLEHYIEDKRQLEEMRQDLIPSPTASYSLTGGIRGSDTNRTTENIAIRIAMTPYIRQLEQSCKAIDYTIAKCQPIDRDLINLVYWRHEYTVEGAALKKHMHPATAYRHINDILTAIAIEFGYVTM